MRIARPICLHACRFLAIATFAHHGFFGGFFFLAVTRHCTRGCSQRRARGCVRRIPSGLVLGESNNRCRTYIQWCVRLTACYASLALLFEMRLSGRGFREADIFHRKACLQERHLLLLGWPGRAVEGHNSVNSDGCASVLKCVAPRQGAAWVVCCSRYGGETKQCSLGVRPFGSDAEQGALKEVRGSGV